MTTEPGAPPSAVSSNPVSSAPSALAVDYYRQVHETLLVHLRGRAITGFGSASWAAGSSAQPGHGVSLHISEAQDLEEAVRSGVVGFRIADLDAPGLVGLRISPGEGCEIDTVATAALSLATSMGRDGLAATAFTDGAGGLYLLAWGVGAVNPGAVAETYVLTLTWSAPEMATGDKDDSDGRALLEVLALGADGVPAPYSLVPRPSADNSDEPGVVVPLTLDEVAAASAGMALDIAPSDVPSRIAAYGDLATAWGQATRGPA